MSITLNQAVENYLTELALEGKSPDTILWHRKKLTALCAFMKNGGEPPLIRDLTIDDVKSVVKSLMERKTRYDHRVFRREMEGGLAPQTIHGFVRSLRAWASWLFREGYTDEHILADLKPPKLPQILIQPLTEDEIRRLLILIPQHTAEGARSHAKCRTIWSGVSGPNCARPPL